MYAAPPLTAMRRSNATCTAADVNGVPSWKVTPFRRWNVYTVFVLFAVHEVASRGAIFTVSVSFAYCTSPSYVLRTIARPLFA
jgi:hypothetical protein